MCPMKEYPPVLQTQPKPPHIWLLYCHVVTRIQKNRSGDNKFVKWKGTFQSNKQDQSKGTTLIFWPGQTKMVKSIWFPPKLLEFLAEWKASLVSKFPNLFSINAILHECKRRRGVLDSTVWMIPRCTPRGWAVPYLVYTSMCTPKRVGQISGVLTCNRKYNFTNLGSMPGLHVWYHMFFFFL